MDGRSGRFCWILLREVAKVFFYTKKQWARSCSRVHLDSLPTATAAKMHASIHGQEAPSEALTKMSAQMGPLTTDQATSYATNRISTDEQSG